MSDIEIPDWTKLGSTIRSERRRAGLSQQALAARASLSRSWRARLEAGHRTAELESVMRLLRALDLTLVLRRADDLDDHAPDPGPITTDDPTLATAFESLRNQHRRSSNTRRQAWNDARTDHRRDDD